MLEKKINLEAFLRCISSCPFYLRKNRTHSVLVKTGKAAFVVPAALCDLSCSEWLLLGPCMAGACWRL